MLPNILRFRDLKERGIVRNWVTLGEWIRNRDFPPGRMTGHLRFWTEQEIAEWLENCPVEHEPYAKS